MTIASNALAEKVSCGSQESLAQNLCVQVDLLCRWNTIDWHLFGEQEWFWGKVKSIDQEVIAKQRFLHSRSALFAFSRKLHRFPGKQRINEESTDGDLGIINVVQFFIELENAKCSF